MGDIYHTHIGGQNGNCNLAQRLYTVTFSNRKCPTKGAFTAIHQCLRERGSFKHCTENCLVQRVLVYAFNRMVDDSKNNRRMSL